MFVKGGIASDWGFTWLLPRIVGIGRAKEWMVTGRMFDAREALASGLVSSVYPSAELVPAAQSLAAEIIRYTAAVSVVLTRRLPRHGLDGNALDAHLAESMGMFEHGQSADAREGVRSFVQKRAPVFPDKASAVLLDVGT